MKYSTYYIDNKTFDDTKKSIEKAGGWWVRFGTDMLTYAANNRWSDVDARFSADKRNARQNAGSVRKSDMHLVVQKGRTFQQENPDAEVLYDKGRYLVVAMSPAKAKQLAKRKDVCFHIMPLEENQVVFEEYVPKRTEAPTDTPEAGIVAGVQKSVFESYISQLVSYPTRLSTSSHYMEAAGWANGVLAGMGYGTSLETVSLSGGKTSANVVAKRQGNGGIARENIIVVAHLDSVNHPGGASADAPGADDNASGSAGLLTLAAACSGHEFAHDLTFILFGGEEQGLHGSTQYVASLPPAERARTRAVLNMDMIGSVNATPPAVLLEGATLSQSLIDGLATSAAQFTTLTVQTSLNPFASDHVPFIDEGIPAVLTIEGADGANSAIHTGDDTLDKIDADFAISILRMNAGFIAAEAGVIKPPADCGCGGGADTPPVTAEEAQAARELALHYQALFAQYSRLWRDGLLSSADYGNWQSARAAHDALMQQMGVATPHTYPQNAGLY
ncbi:M28 family metallopeptidase [uncultured Roseovarius sp.]|uniref:M28 family metallopeptidase n=1 Tax=uncultured Roseovarius sp. TaxID=293344 RepID=UPI00262ADB6D|nr:M28 family metallopeptidase [uncultured Roseovarius sp.]